MKHQDTTDVVVDVLRHADTWLPPLSAEAAAAVSKCIDRARRVARIDPGMAVGLTKLATSAAAQMGYKREDVLLRSNAWREHAESLARVGLHDEAIAAVGIAEQAIGGVVSAPFDRARLVLTRANVLIQVRRGLDIIFAVRDAASVFLQLGEKQQFVNARLIEAVILNQAGRPAHALAVWRDIERDLGDDTGVDAAATFGVMFSTIAICFRMLGDYSGARVYYARAKGKFEACGYTVDVVKAEWGLAKISICEGDLAAGCAELERVVHGFSSLSMRLDEALAELDRVDVLLALGRASEARRVSKRIVGVFDRAGMNRELVRALAHLHEALTGKSEATVRTTVIPHVREFFESTRVRAAARYEPPPC